MENDKVLPRGWVEANITSTVKKIPITGIKIKEKDYKIIGKYPIVDQGQTFISGYFNDDKMIVPDVPPYIVFGDHTKIKKYINFHFIAGGDGLKVLKTYECFVPKLFYYFLHSLKLLDKGYARHFQHLEKLNIPIPPLQEQHRIVEKIEELFSELDKGVENLKTIQQQLKVYRQAVLKWAFEGRLTEEWRKNKCVDNIISLVTIESTCIITGGITKNSKRKEMPINLPYLRVANVYSNKFKLDEIDNIGVTEKEKERTLLKYGDLLFVEGNGSIDQIGRVAMWKEQLKDCLHQNHLLKVRPQNDIESKYLLYYFISSEGRDLIKKVASSTSGLYTLSISKIGCLKFPLRDKKEQQQIVQEIETRLSVCDKLEETIEQSLKQAEALRQSILKKAFEGKLVSQDPNDEPAEKLLERIKAERLTQQSQNKARKGRKNNE